MPAAMGDFLRARDLEALVSLHAELDRGSADAVADTVEQWSDRQALANLLMYPDVMAAAQRVPALLRALAEGSDGYLRLAAAVGVGDLERASLGDGDRVALRDAMLDLIAADDGLPASRAAASLSVVVGTLDAPEIVVLLPHPNATVRRNLQGVLARLLGDETLADLLDDRDEVTAEDAAAAYAALAADGIDPHLPCSQLRLLPRLDYLPNLEDWDRRAHGRQDGG